MIPFIAIISICCSKIPCHKYIFKEYDMDRDIFLANNYIDRDFPVAKNDNDRDSSMAKHYIDRDISLAKNVIDR